MTERRQKAQEAREGELFRLLAENVKDYAIFVIDPQGRVESWNPGAERLLGYREEEIIGHSAEVFFTKEDIAKGVPQREMQQAREEGRGSDDRWHVRKDSSRFWAGGMMTPLWDEGRNLRGFAKIMRDRTEWKQAEEARASQTKEAERLRRLYDAALSNTPDLVYVFDLDHRFTYANAGLLATWGRTWDEAIGKTCLELGYEPCHAAMHDREIEQVVATKQPVRGEVPFTGTFGRRLYEYIFVPVIGDNGEVEAVAGTTRDVTERRQAEEALRESEGRFRNLFDSMDEGFCVVEMLDDGAGRPADYRFLEANPTFERHTGFKNAVGRTIRELVPDHDAHWFETYGAVAATGQPARFVNEAKAMGRWYDVYAYRLGGPDSRRVAILFTDITDRKRAEDDLRQMAADLSEADQRKDEFLATLAHELRNPLAPIRNSLQILKMPRVDAETAQRSRDMMERQVHHLVRLVDDLLDVSRVMRGKIELRRERVELATVVARAVEMAQPLIDAQGHELTVSLPPESLPLDADPVRLAQVVGNLLTNAAKYTETKGRIWLTAQREGAQAVLRVRDTGIGIAPDILPKVFDLFVQVDHAATKSQGGLGIGLTLVKNLVEMHHGTVKASSTGLGKGSEFVVRLPLSALEHRGRIESENGVEPQESLPLSGHRLLVVDDNVDAADSLAMLLRLQGHEVRVAHDGPATLEMVKGYRPEMLFLDIGMPGMDGYEVARRIRREPQLAGVVLVALTGWGQEADRRRSSAAGFDHHLVKPVEPDAVQKVLAGLHRAKP